MVDNSTASVTAQQRPEQGDLRGPYKWPARLHTPVAVRIVTADAATTAEKWLAVALRR